MKDGSSVYSKTISLQNTSRKLVININPNPIRDKLTVTVENSDASTAIFSIINSCGKIYINQKEQFHQGKNSLLVKSTSKLAKGVYVLKIQTDNNLVSKVFIKE